MHINILQHYQEFLLFESRFGVVVHCSAITLLSGNTRHSLMGEEHLVEVANVCREVGIDALCCEGLVDRHTFQCFDLEERDIRFGPSEGR